MKFRQYFEGRTGMPLDGLPATKIVYHMRLIADIFGDYVDEVVKEKLDHPLIVAYPVEGAAPSYEVGSGRDIPEAWMPSDCQDRNSCAKNGTCQYTGCSASPWHLTEDGLTHETEVAARNFDFNEQECDSPLPELRCTTCNCWKITREFSG